MKKSPEKTAEIAIFQPSKHGVTVKTQIFSLRFPPIWTWLRRWSPKDGNSRSRNDAFKTLKLGKGWEKDGKIDGKHGKNAGNHR